MTIEARYLKLFVILQLPLMSSLRRIVSFPRLHYNGTHTDFQNHVYFEVLRYFSAWYKHCYFAYLLNILTIILDRSDGLLTTLPKSIVSKKKLCDIWLIINLHGNKKNAALIFSASQPEWKGLFSKPATLDRIKVPWRTIKEYLSYLANFEFLSIISQQDIITV